MPAATFTLAISVAELAGGPVEDARVIVEAMVTPEGNAVVTDPSNGQIRVTESYELPNGVGSLTLPVSSQMSPAGYQYGATVRYRREGDRTYREVPRIVFNSGAAGATVNLGNVAPQAVVLPPTYFPGGIAGPQGNPGTPGTGSVNLPELARNLVTNPDIALDTTGWSGVNGVSVARTSDRAVFGSTSLQITCATFANEQVVRTTVAGLTVGRTYTWSAYLYVPTTGGPGGAGFISISVAGIAYGPQVAERDRWVRLVQTFTATATSHLVSVSVINMTAGVFQLDGAQVTEGLVLWDYFDGSMSGCYWTGTAHNSSSVKGLYDADDVLRAERSPELARNLALPLAAGVNLFGATSHDVIIDGEPWLELRGVSDTSPDTFYAPEGEQGGVHFDIKPGRRYTVQAEVWNVNVPTTADPGTGPRLQPFTESLATGYVPVYSPNVGPGSRRILTAVMDVPPDARQAWVRLYHGAAAPNTVVRYRNFVVTEGGPELAPGHFDGSTPGCRWLGAPGASQSVKMLPKRHETLVNAPELSRNLLARGSMRTLDGWIVGGSGPGAILPDSQSPTGVVRRFTKSGGGGFIVTSPTEYDRVPHAAANGPVTMSGYVRSELGGTVSFRLYWYDSAGNVLPGASAEFYVTDTSLRRVLFTATPPAGAASCRPDAYTFGDSNGETFDVAAFQLERGTVATEYTDGDMPGCRWLGERLASPSVRMLHGPEDQALLTWLDAGRAQGKGSPEGRVAAPVGTRYVDTARTTGALEWIKDGGGSTASGWKVTKGDTGWRSLNPWMDTATWGLNGTTQRLRRRDDMVELSLSLDANQLLNNQQAYDFLNGAYGWPQGYYPTNSAHETDQPLADQTGKYPGAVLLLRYGGRPQVYLAGMGAYQGGFRGTHRWVTDQPWPAVLPGSPE